MSPIDYDPNTEEEEEVSTVLMTGADLGTATWGAFTEQQLRENPWLLEAEEKPEEPKPNVQPMRPQRARAILRDYLAAFTAALGLTVGFGTCTDLALTVAQPPRASNIADACPEGMSPGSWVLMEGAHVLYRANTPVSHRAFIDALVPGGTTTSFPPEVLWSGCVPDECKGAKPQTVQFFVGEDNGTYRFVLSKPE